MKKVLLLIIRNWKIFLPLNIFIILVILLARNVLGKEEYWIADTKLLLPDVSAHLTANLGTLGSLQNENPRFSAQINPLKLQISILESDVLMDRVWHQDPEKDEFLKLSKYKKKFDISIAEQSPIVHISAEGSSPDLAQSRLENLTNFYQQRLGELRQENNNSRTQFSQIKLQEAIVNLEQSQAALSRFQTKFGLVNPEEQTRGLVTTISRLQEEYVRTQSEAEASINQVNVLSERLNLSPEAAIQALSLQQNDGYLAVRQKLVDISIQIAEEQTRFTEASPTIQALLAQYNSLYRELESYINVAGVSLPNTDLTVTSGAEGRTNLIEQMLIAESIAQAKQQQADRMSTEINSLRQVLSGIPEANLQLLSLQRDYEVAEGVYNGLIAQIEQSNLDAFNAYPNVQVLDPPKVEPTPVPSNLKLVLANAILAIAFANIAAVLTLEGYNPLLTPSDLKTQSFTFVASIPLLLNPLPKMKNGNSFRTPEFNLLAENCLSILNTDEMLLIMSAEYGEGKTVMTLRLAQALSMFGLKILMVDTSLNNQLTQEYADEFEAPKQINEFDYFETKHRNLAIASVRSPYSLDLKFFTTGDFKSKVEQLKIDYGYDYVLIDTSPLSDTSIPLVISQLFHQVLLVVQPNYSKRNSVLKLLSRLSQNPDCRMGLVLNKDTEKTNLKQLSAVNQ